jgi:hypothetical protein
MIRKLLDRILIRRSRRTTGVTAGAVALALVIGVQAAIAMVGGQASEPAAATPEVTLTPAPAAAAESAPVEPPAAAEDADFKVSAGGARLVVNVRNHKDADNHARGRIQLNRIQGWGVAPVNIAIAQSTCTDCETLAVALQVSTYERGARYVAPQNAAVAVNAECLRCFTMAVAIQYLIPVDPATALPHDVRQLAKDLNRELKEVTRDQSTTVRDRMPRIVDVINRFRQFVAYVDMRTNEETAPNAATGDPVSTPLPETTDDPALSPEPTASETAPATEPPGSTPSDEPAPSPSGLTDPSEEPPTPSPSPPPT